MSRNLMSHQSVVVVVVAVLLLASNDAEAVACYECDSISSSTCGASIADANTCGVGKSSTCYTFNGTSASGLTSAQWRGCYDTTEADGCQQNTLTITGGIVFDGTFCFCSTSQCNDKALGSNDDTQDSDDSPATESRGPATARGLVTVVILTTLIGAISRCVA